MFGGDEDWLWDVANEMDQEDGLIWVYGPANDGVMAFTDFGIEALVDLIETMASIPRPSSDQAICNRLCVTYAECLPQTCARPH